MTSDNNNNGSRSPRRHPSNAFRPVGEDGGLVVDPRQSKVQVLNPVGSLIFSMLDGGHSHDEIVRAVVDEYEVSADEARRDLDLFLQQLESEKLLAQENGKSKEEGAQE